MARFKSTITDRGAEVLTAFLAAGKRLVLVSAAAGNANNVRNVNSDGSLSNNNAYNGNNGVRPDLVENATE